jgi:hypothetical protein
MKLRIRTARLRAAVAVNEELILLYWGIGRDIFEREGRVPSAERNLPWIPSRPLPSAVFVNQPMTKGGGIPDRTVFFCSSCELPEAGGRRGSRHRQRTRHA